MDIGTLSAPQQANASGAFASASSTKEISSDFETFLKMLTVQMQNQDPLNPVDSSDYAVQLATFSGVEQQVQTNDLLRGLTALMGTSGMAQMASWVGKEARAPVAAYFGGSPVTLAPTPRSSRRRPRLLSATRQAPKWTGSKSPCLPIRCSGLALMRGASRGPWVSIISRS